jgi:cellulose synthase/poly-beta-1,6-N-acetylglucosamine synthase-like glycosyltransferase
MLPQKDELSGGEVPLLTFSIVIPDLNTPGVDKTIAALENQDFERTAYEIIVVGMDKFGLVHESDLVTFDRSAQPLPPAAARNRGAAQARGDVLVFTDADCIARPNWLRVLAGRFTDPDVDVVGGGIEFASQNYWTTSDNLSMFYEFLAIQPAGERRQLPSLNLAIRRKVFTEIGGFDERYPRPAGEDADLTIRLRKKGHTLHFEPGAVIYHDPPRHRLSDLLRHAYYQGKYSTKADPRYKKEEGLPGIIGTRAGFVFFAPILAAGVTLKIMANKSILRRYWASAPAIFLAKTAWCLGASNHPGW